MVSPRSSLLALALVTALAGCGPKVVTDIALSPTTARFTWMKKSMLYPETGIVECARAEDGSLSDCQPVQITFREPDRSEAEDE